MPFAIKIKIKLDEKKNLLRHWAMHSTSKKDDCNCFKFLTLTDLCVFFPLKISISLCSLHYFVVILLCMFMLEHGFPIVIESLPDLFNSLRFTLKQTFILTHNTRCITRLYPAITREREKGVDRCASKLSFKFSNHNFFQVLVPWL